MKRYFVMGFILLLSLTPNLFWAKTKLPEPCYLLELSSIGFPVAEKQKDAWKVHELCIFNDRLYIGHGDAVVNTGPTDVIYYDFRDQKFITEFTVDDEAIHSYQVIDNCLMIPGIDATEDWTFGNFYILTDTGWVKFRTIPNGLHVNYLASYAGKLYASTGTFGKIGDKIEFYFGGVYSSSDTGKTWILSYATPSDDQSVYRVNALVVYKDKLYAFPFAYTGLKKEEIPEKYHAGLSQSYEEGYYLIHTEDIFGQIDVLVYDGKRWRTEDLIPQDKLCYISRPFVFKDKLIMPALFGEYIDYLSKKPPSQAKTRLWAFDGKNTKLLKFDYDMLLDILIKGDDLYLLIKKRELFYIAQTKDLRTWNYYLIPPMIKDPKSIELNDDRFYIGAEDGNIYQSVASKLIWDLIEAEKFVPRKIFGAAELPRDGKWYWVAISEWQKWGKLAKISAEVTNDSTINVTTENISKMSIFLPVYYLDLNKDITLLIDDKVACKKKTSSAQELICKLVSNVWKVENGEETFETFECTKKLVGITEIELKRGGEDPLVGCWKADVLRWYVGADAAIITRSGVRKDITTIEIYLEDIFDMHYRNYICTFEATGQELKEMMEFNVQSPDDRRCQISGFTIKYEEKDSIKKIVECTLNPKKRYIVATEDYLAKRAKRFFDREIEFRDCGKSVYDAMIDWFDKFKTIKDLKSRIEKLP